MKIITIRSPRAIIIRLLGLSLVAALLLTPTLARANEQVYQKLLPNTTWVVVDMGNNMTSTGTGVLVSAKKKWVLTNSHVVRDKTDVYVFFPVSEQGSVVASKQHYVSKATQLKVSGKVVARDSRKDIAVIELESLPAEAKGVALAKASALPGQVIHSIGCPATEPALWLYSHGKVRQVYQKQMASKTTDGFQIMMNCKMLHSTAPINPGDSGGPVVNDKGELVALVSGWVPGSNALSFMIDISEIRDVLAQTLKGQAPNVTTTSTGPTTPSGPGAPSTPVPAPANPTAKTFSLLGTWKASTTNNQGVQVQVTMTADANNVKFVFQNVGAAQPHMTIAGPYTFTNNQLNIQQQGQWQNLGNITWTNATSFSFQDALVTLQFQKVS